MSRDGARGLTSRPCFDFTIGAFWLHHLCEIAGLEPRGSCLWVRLVCNWKGRSVESFADASVNASDTVTSQEYSGVSDFVDGVYETQLTSLKGRVFKDATDLINNLQSAVSEYLRTSLLAPLIDFVALQITLEERTGNRFAGFAKLNSDGTEKYPIELSKPVFETKEPTAQRSIESRVHPDRTSNEADKASALDDTEDRHEDAFSGSNGSAAGGIHML